MTGSETQMGPRVGLGSLGSNIWCTNVSNSLRQGPRFIVSHCTILVPCIVIPRPVPMQREQVLSPRHWYHATARKTRMHSSRMRTARLRIVGGRCCPGGIVTLTGGEVLWLWPGGRWCPLLPPPPPTMWPIPWCTPPPPPSWTDKCLWKRNLHSLCYAGGKYL